MDPWTLGIAVIIIVGALLLALIFLGDFIEIILTIAGFMLVFSAIAFLFSLTSSSGRQNAKEMLDNLVSNIQDTENSIETTAKISKLQTKLEEDRKNLFSKIIAERKAKESLLEKQEASRKLAEAYKQAKASGASEQFVNQALDKYIDSLTIIYPELVAAEALSQEASQASQVMRDTIKELETIFESVEASKNSQEQLDNAKDSLESFVSQSSQFGKTLLADDLMVCRIIGVFREQMLAIPDDASMKEEAELQITKFAREKAREFLEH